MEEKEAFVSGHKACPGCGCAIAIRNISKAISENGIVVAASGSARDFSAVYPNTAWKIPWIHAGFDNAALVARGVEIGLKAKNSQQKVILIGGDSFYSGAGISGVSEAVENKSNICFVCYDNESSGGYGSSPASPKFSKSFAKNQAWQKPISLTAASQKLRYVATASISDIDDLSLKITKCINTSGSSFLHVHSPCPTTFGIAPSETIKFASLAVSTGYFPIFEIEKGKLIINKKMQNLIPINEFIKGQQRFNGITETELTEFQDHVRYYYEYLLSLESKGKVFL